MAVADKKDHIATREDIIAISREAAGKPGFFRLMLSELGGESLVEGIANGKIPDDEVYEYGSIFIKVWGD